MRGERSKKRGVWEKGTGGKDVSKEHMLRVVSAKVDDISALQFGSPSGVRVRLPTYPVGTSGGWLTQPASLLGPASWGPRTGQRRRRASFAFLRPGGTKATRQGRVPLPQTFHGLLGFSLGHYRHTTDVTHHSPVREYGPRSLIGVKRSTRRHQACNGGFFRLECRLRSIRVYSLCCNCFTLF